MSNLEKYLFLILTWEDMSDHHFDLMPHILAGYYSPQLNIIWRSADEPDVFLHKYALSFGIIQHKMPCEVVMKPFS